MARYLPRAKGLGIGERFKREIVSYLQGFQGFEIEYLLERAERNYGEDAFDEKKKKILELMNLLHSRFPPPYDMHVRE